MQQLAETNLAMGLLEGLIIEPSRHWPTRYKVLSPLDEQQEQALLDIPGTEKWSCYSDKKERVLLPRNLVHMGKRHPNLAGYAPDPQETTPSGLLLKEYQRQSVSFLRQLEDADEGGILAAAPGLGKTVTALQALWLDGRLHRRGIVCGPLLSRPAWVGEGSDPMTHFNMYIHPLEGTTPDKAVLQHPWLFIHYDILDAWSLLLFYEHKADTIIFDESHMLMALRGKRADAAARISAGSPSRRVCLTGTPVPKTRMDLFRQLAIAQPNQWGRDPFKFGMRYAAGYRKTFEDGRGAMVYEGESNTVELRARLCGCYLRYTKADVWRGDIRLVRTVVPIEMSLEDRKEYQTARMNILKYMDSKLDETAPAAPSIITIGGLEIDLEGKKGAPQLQTVGALKSILSRVKIEKAPHILWELYQQHNLLVVFVWTRQSAKDLVAALKERGAEVIGPIDGTDPMQKRVDAAREFAKKERAVFIATKGAAGCSLNDLKAANACVQVVPDWNPDTNIQAEDRLYREGQKSSTVYSYYFLTPDSLDDRIMELLHKKGQEAANICEKDQDGLMLVAALDPNRGDDTMSISDIYRLLRDAVEQDKEWESYATCA